MSFMLDTNVVSLAMNADARVLERLAGLGRGEVAISAVTYAEVCYGLERRTGMERKRELFERLLEHLDVISWDRDAASAYAGERASCEEDGQPLDQADLMILAHAGSTGRTLVTRDVSLHRRDRKGPFRTNVVSW